MKTPMITAAALLLAASAFAGNGTRQAWSGLLQQKSMDQYGNVIGTANTLTAGLSYRKDVFTHTSYNWPDPQSGMDPLPDDIAAQGYILMWWDHGGEGDRMAIKWQRTYAGTYTKEVIAQDDFNIEPVGISFFSGLMVSEEGRARTLGGFAFEIENRDSKVVTATVVTDWMSNEMVPAHRTTHGGSVPPGSLRVIPIVPERDEWALVDGRPIEEVR